MIKNWGKPVYNPNTDTYEISIKVVSGNIVSTQTVEFANLTSAQQYITYLQQAVQMRKR